MTKRIPLSTNSQLAALLIPIAMNAIPIDKKTRIPFLFLTLLVSVLIMNSYGLL